MVKRNHETGEALAPSRGIPFGFDPFFRLRGEIEDLFSRYYHPAPSNGVKGDMLVAVDVAETELAYQVKLDVPGVKRDDIYIDYEQGRLTISGERRHEETKEEKAFRRAERSFGAFSTSFALPGDVDGNKIEAELADGVLTVTVPKSVAAKKTARKITVKAG